MATKRTTKTHPVHLLLLSAVTYLVCAAVVVTWLPVMLVAVTVTRPFDRTRRLAGTFLRFGAVLIARSFPRWRVRVEGRWPADDRAYVVVANHLSHADILLLSHLPREMKWMSKVTGFRVPIMGWLFALAGDLAVRPGDPAANGRTLRRARAYLRDGMNVMIFPEGKRNGGELLPFRPGAFRLALEAGVPVLPVAVTGTDQAMPRGGALLRPATMSARILEPVESAAFAPGGHALLQDEVRRRIADALARNGDAAPGERRRSVA